jgi:dTMP kinase
LSGGVWSMVRGRFISFEGGEGAGKSTQLARLAERLTEAGLAVVRTREPGGTEGADAIRELLVTGATDRWDPVSEVLLHYAARRDHVERVIKPALDRSDWVVCDRFADSTMAYQGYGYGLGSDVIDAVHRVTLGDFNTDMTIIMDVSPAEGLARARARDPDPSRYERFDLDFHERLRSGFMAIAKAAPDRCLVVDAGGPIDEVADAVWQAVADKLGGDGGLG